MSQLTYTLNPKINRAKNKQIYKKSQLELMTTFHLREICRKEQLVTASINPTDRDGFIRLIMRFRGQKDYRHISKYCEGGLKRLQHVLDEMTIHTIQEDGINLPASMVLFHDIATDEFEKLRFSTEEISLYEGNLLLVDEQFHLYTCLYLKQIDREFFICRGKDVPILPMEKHPYSILYFPSESVSEYLYDRYFDMKQTFQGTIRCIRIPLLDFKVESVKDTKLPLVIDFGSCNTTMGIFLPDGQRKIAASSDGYVMPSAIRIAAAADGSLEYEFGHQAKTACNNNYPDQDVPVFYDINRWISAPNRMESVTLANGVNIQIIRKDMLKAFFNYLLEEAQKQFKLHFTSLQLLAPIQQKEKIKNLFREILPDMKVDCTLDKGMAVLFSSINKMTVNANYEPNRWYQALILDCGGRTTDLTAGKFRINNGRVAYKIDLETSFENGDTNFGGNKLTYEILKSLKVKICKELTQKELWKGLKIEEAYEISEQFLPTAFLKYADKSKDEYFAVKNNYYYLFELAEHIKTKMLQPDFLYEVWICTDESELKHGKNQLFLDKWKLSIVKNNRLIPLNQSMKIPFYLQQVESLLRPFIHNLMKRFLESKFNNNELQDYNMIILTGQSCKSRLFEEALKEYIPGVLIQKNGQDQEGDDRKMCCLNGALSYFYNCNLGYMDVNWNNRIGALPYEITALTHEGKEKILIHSACHIHHIGYISRYLAGMQLDIQLRDSFGGHLKTYYYECNMDEFKQTTQESIDQAYAGTVIQEETDTIKEGEIRFFVWVNTKQWGFVVLALLRENEKLFKGKETFFYFEDDTWEEDFFNGNK